MAVAAAFTRVTSGFEYFTFSPHFVRKSAGALDYECPSLGFWFQRTTEQF
jgi:hypothetical protein